MAIAPWPKHEWPPVGLTIGRGVGQENFSFPRSAVLRQGWRVEGEGKFSGRNFGRALAVTAWVSLKFEVIRGTTCSDPWERGREIGPECLPESARVSARV